MDRSSDGATINVPETTPPSGDGFVVIRGFRPTTTEETLRNFLENKRRTGGGDVSHLTVDNGRAIACFVDPQVAARLTAIGTLTLEGAKVKVSYPDDDDYQYSIYYDRTIEVSGFPASTTRDALMYFFENPKIGGGKVNILRLINHGFSALVTFESQTVTRQLLEGIVQFRNDRLDITKPYRRSTAEYLDSDDSMESDNSGQEVAEEIADKRHSQRHYSESAQGFLQGSGRGEVARGGVSRGEMPGGQVSSDEMSRDDISRGEESRDDTSRDHRSANNQHVVPDNFPSSRDTYDSVYKTARCDQTDPSGLHQDGFISNLDYEDDRKHSGIYGLDAGSDLVSSTLTDDKTTDITNSSSPEFDIIDDNDSDNNVKEAAPYPFDGNIGGLLDNMTKHYTEDIAAAPVMSPAEPHSECSSFDMMTSGGFVKIMPGRQTMQSVHGDDVTIPPKPYDVTIPLVHDDVRNPSPAVDVPPFPSSSHGARTPTNTAIATGRDDDVTTGRDDDITTGRDDDVTTGRGDDVTTGHRDDVIIGGDDDTTGRDDGLASHHNVPKFRDSSVTRVFEDDATTDSVATAGHETVTNRDSDVTTNGDDVGNKRHGTLATGRENRLDPSQYPDPPVKESPISSLGSVPEASGGGGNEDPKLYPDLTGMLAEDKSDSDRKDKALAENQMGLTSDECTPNAKILVTSIPANTSDDGLFYFFENPKKCCGGEVKFITLNKECRTAELTFVDPETAERLLAMGEVDYEGTRLQIVSPPSERVRRTIVVTGLNPNTSEQLLRNFFTNARRTGGGDIESLDHSPAKGRAVVTFQELNAAKRVLARQNLILEGSTLVLSKCTDGDLDYTAEDQERTPHAADIEPTPPRPPAQHIERAASSDSTHNEDERRVIVTGLNSTTSEDLLQNCFENKKRTGGGEIETLDYKPESGWACITFRDREVVDRLLHKKELFLEGAQLHMSLFVDDRRTTRDVTKQNIQKTSSVIYEDGNYERESMNSAPGGSRSRRLINSEPLIAPEHDQMERVYSATRRSAGRGIMSRDPRTEPGYDEGRRVNSASLGHHGRAISSGDPLIAPVHHEARRQSWGPQSAPGSDREIRMKNANLTEPGYHARGVINPPSSIPPAAGHYGSGRVISDELAEAHDTGGARPKHSDNTMSAHDQMMGESASQRQTSMIEVTGFTLENTDVIVKEFLYHIKDKNLNIVTYSLTGDPPRLYVWLMEMMDGSSLSGEMTLRNMRLVIRPVHNHYNVLLQESSSIEAEPLPPGMSESFLTLAFESHRYGGGPVRELVLLEDDNKAIITFEETEVANGILQKKRFPLHNQVLNVRRLEPVYFPLLILGPAYDDRVLVKGIPTSSTAGNLKDYFAQFPGIAVKDITIGSRDGVALLEFISEIDYDQLCQFCIYNHLRGTILCVEKVAVSSCIQINNTNSILDEMISLYFENDRRSGGGPIQNLVRHKDDDCVVLQYEDIAVASKVLSKQHTLSDRALPVRIFYEGLGIVLSNTDGYVRKCRVPANINVTFPNTPVAKYFQQRDSVKMRVEQRLSDDNVCVCWQQPDQDETVVTLKFAKDNATIGEIKKWNDIAESSWNRIMDNYTASRLSVSSAMWKAFNERIRTTQTLTELGDDVAIDINDHDFIVTVSGIKSDVAQYISALNGIQQDLELMSKREQRHIPLESSLLELLKAKRFFEKQKEKYKELAVAYENGKLVITGLQINIQTVQQDMYGLLSEKCEVDINLSPRLSQLVHSDTIKKYIADKIEERKVTVVFVNTDNSMKLLGFTRYELDEARKVIEENLVEKTIELKDSMIPALQLDTWKHLKLDLFNKYQDMLIITELRGKHGICVATVKENIRTVVERISDFVSKNSFVDQFVHLPVGMIRFLQKYKDTNLRSLEDQQQGKSVSITVVDEDRSRTGLVIKCTQDCIERVLEGLETIKQHIVQGAHDIIKPGMPKLFFKEKGEDLIKTIEMRERVTIEKILPGETAQVHDTVQVQARNVQKRGPDIRCFVDMDGKKIYISRGDITSYPVQAIVNAANGDLRHIGGLAAAIVTAGGQSIQDECSDYVLKNRSLWAGENFVSGAGSLRHDIVIHAVGPMWSGGYNNEPDELYETVYGSLKSATERNITTIALPLISSGIYGFPVDSCGKIVLDAVKDYLCEEQTSIKEVHIVDTNNEALRQLERSLEAKYGIDQVQKVRTKGNLELTRPVSSRAMQRPNVLDTSYDNSNSGAATEGSYGSDSLVKLTKRNLEMQQTDVIVNTTNPQLNLNSGNVSSLLLRVGGSQLQSECKQNYPGGITPGDVAVTSGGRLPCQHVYHVACIAWDGGAGQCEQVLRKIMQNCLRTAHSTKMSSISFPALGTGNLKVPPHLVANIMFDESAKFKQTNPTTSLKDVYIVLYSGDGRTVQAFESNIKQRDRALPIPSSRDLSGLYQSSRRSVHAEPSSYNEEDFETLEYPEADEPTEGTSGIVMSSTGLIKIRNCTVEVKQGDITQETTDAIINSTDKTLSFNGAVSAAIARKAGPSFIAETEQIGRIKDGVAVTSAGNLPCRYVIHVVAPKSVSRWEEIIKKVFKEAERYELTSVSFPALGTGNLGIPPGAMADVMIRAIVDHTERSSNSLCRVNICIFQRDMVRIFRDATKTSVSKQKGIWDQVKGAVKSFFSIDDSIGDPPSGATERRPQAAARGLTRRGMVRRPAPDVPKNLSMLKLHIYANSQEDITRAKASLDRFCKVESGTKSIEDKLITTLTSEQEAVMKDIATAHNVKLSVVKGQRVSRIVMEGYSGDLLEITDQIHSILRHVNETEHQQAEADIISQQVTWSYEESNAFHEYPKEVNALIEKAYSKKDKFAEWRSKDGDVYKIVFDKMVEKISGDNCETRVMRYSGKEDLPSFWDKMDGKICIRVDLNTQSAEYQNVDSQFQASAGQGHAISKIERIQNHTLYRQYTIKKEQMGAKAAEQILWHGTSGDVIDQINTNGFNRSLSGKNATMYGKGTYFAVNSSYSVNYASPNPTGERSMYLCKVLAGEYTQGNRSMVVPPAKDPNVPHILFDSLVDNQQNPQIYVIFHDTQVYPEYLITFT